MNTEKQQDQWAIVELFGHSRIAGRVSEQTIGGQSFVRVDVPEVTVDRPGYGGPKPPVRIAPHTKSFGAGAIYAVNWCDEAAARLAAAQIRHAPIDAYALEDALRVLPASDRQRLLARPVVAIEGAGEPDYDDLSN